jgi:hypothetical protein
MDKAVIEDTNLEGQAQPSRVAYGGKTIYGARIGLLMMDTDFPRIPGDLGNAETWPFPMLYKVIRGATPKRVNTDREGWILDAFIEAGKEMVADGAEGLTTSCGFLTLYQADLAAACGVPVAASSLMQVPFVERLLPPGKRAGILTMSTDILQADHLASAGIAPGTPAQGCQDGKEFPLVPRRGDQFMDVGLSEIDVMEAGDELVRRHPEVGAVVMECTNMPPFARTLSERIGMPVFTIYSFLTWFHAGLAPRDFGHPGSAPRPWRER